MALEEETYERYLRDIGGATRLNRDLPNEDKITYSKEYGVTAPQSEIKAQKAQDTTFSEYIKNMQASITAGQKELTDYSTTAQQTLKEYASPTTSKYQSWYSTQPMSSYIAGPKYANYTGSKGPQMDYLVPYNPTLLSSIASYGYYKKDMPTSIGDPLINKDLQEGMLSTIGSGTSADPVYQSWSSEMTKLYEPAYQEYLTNVQKYQGELTLAESKVKGEMDVHQETLDAMRQRYAASVKRRTDNLKQLKVGGQV